jgi:hypothetical protein
MPFSLVRRLCFAILVLAPAGPLPAQLLVSGTVAGPSGLPLAGARVELLPMPSNFEAGRMRLAGLLGPDPVADARSDAAGRFLLRAPASGAFRVLVRGDGMIPLQLAPLFLVEDEELPPAALAPDAGARFQVTDPEGRPLAEAWVFAEGAGEREASGSIAAGWRPHFRIGKTSPEGRVTLPRAPGERLDLSIFPSGGAEEKKTGLEGGTLGVPPGAARVRSLRIVSPRGEPVAGILVRGGALAWPLGLTDAEGRLRFHGKDGEEARLWLMASDGRQQLVELPARTGDGPAADLVFADPVVLSGRVTGRAGAQPLASALVGTALDPGGFVLTDADGRYRLVAPDAQGLTLEARAPLHLPRAARITHPKTGRAPTLSLSRAVSLQGLVVDPQGAPVPGAGLAAVLEPGGKTGPAGELVDLAAGRGVTDAAGRFELWRLRPGAFYELRIGKTGYLPVASKAVASEPARGAQSLRIVLSPARSARGRVSNADGLPVADAEVRLTPSLLRGQRSLKAESGEPAAGDDPFAARTDSRGQFVITQAPAAQVDLTVRKRSHAPSLVRGIRIPPGPGTAELGTVVLRPGARIAGRVIDRTGKPVADAGVHLVESLDRLDDRSARLEGEEPDAVAGDDGRFALEDLASGLPLNLLVRAPGHLPAGVRNVRAPSPKPLTVRLEAAALLRGRVVSAEGDPIAGARIDFLWEASVPDRPERKTGAPVERSTASDRDGRFELRDLPAGTATLSASAKGYVSVEGREVAVPWPDPDRELTLTLERGTVLSGRVATTAGEPVPGARVAVGAASAVSDDEGAYTVEGAPLGRATVLAFHPHYKRFRREMVLEKSGNQLDVTFEAGVEVAGRVVDERGAPVAGARVALQSVAARERQEYQGRTGTDGTFRISPVSRGRYRLSAEGEDYPPAEAQEHVEVAGKALDGLEVVLEPGGAIAGRVIGLKPEELAQVEVRIRSEAHGTSPVMIDAEGRYEVRRLRPGDYLLQASLAAGQRQAQARASLAPREREVRRDLEFTGRLTLSGQVLYEEEPLPDTQLSIRGHGLAVERSVTTDYEGAFRFEDLEPDTYWLGLKHTREALIHNETIELSGDRDVVIRLQPATVGGVVKDAESGEPVGGASVMLRHVAPEYLVTDATRQDGSFHITRVPPGTYRMAVRADGYSPAEREVAVAVSQDLSGLEFALEPANGIDLAVRLASGRVPDLVHVRVLDGSGAPVVAESLRPDEQGAVRLSTVPSGSWTLLVSAPGGATAAVPVQVPGKGKEVTLPPAGRLRVRVQALASSDLRASVSLSSGGQPYWTLGMGGAVQERWQLVGGSAEVEGVPAGVWQVRAESPDGRVWTGTVASVGQNDTEIVLE